jgi:hypothetical protein
MDIVRLLNEVTERGGTWTINGLKLSIRPKSALTDEQYAFVKAHSLEVIAQIEGKTLADYESADFEATLPKPAKPFVSPTTWVERLKSHLASKSAYYQWPDACIDGRNHPSGKKSVLETLEEMECPVTLNINGMFAFSIHGSRLADDGETVLGDFVIERWAYDEVGCARLAKQARLAAK